MTQKVGGIEFDIDVDANGVSSASSSVQGDLRDLESSFGNLDLATKKSSAELKKLVTSLKESGKKIAANGKVYDAFGMEVKGATAELDRLSKEVIEAGAAAQKSSKGLGSLSKNAGMAGIQVQQFVGQIQGGQSALLALSQQGADLGFVLGRAGLGAAVGIAATALSFLIPALTGAEEETSELRDRIKELGEEVKLTANQIKYLGSQNSKEADKLADANEKAFDKVRQLREEVEKMRSSGTGLDTGQFAVPRSAEENQKRYAASIEETEEKIQKLLTTIDTNSQIIKKLAEDTSALGKETEGAGRGVRDHTVALQAQIIALESGAQAAEVYAATQAAVTNGTEEQLPKVIELINRKYELKAAQDAAAESARAETEQQKAYSSILDEIFAKEKAREAERAAKLSRASSNLEALKQGLMSEEQLRAEAFNLEIEQLKEARDLKLVTQEEYDQLERDKARQHAEALVAIEESRAQKEKEIEDAKNRAKLSALAGVFGNLSSLMNTESRKLFEIGKAAAVAGAIVDGYAAVAKTMATVPYPLNIPLAAAQAVASAAQVKGIMSTNYGSKSVGQSYQGGQVVNNTQQQPQQVTQRNISINLAGSGGFNGGDIRGLISALNEELGDGVTLSATGA